jgi:aspartyl/asparaginyl-tRNA synthetase
VIILIFVIALSNIRIKLRWNRLNGNDEIVLSIIALFGWVKIERTITKVDFINLRNGNELDGRVQKNVKSYGCSKSMVSTIDQTVEV